MNMDEINILHIVKGIDIGGNNGGAESFGIRLSQALRDHGLNVSLCAYLRYRTPVESQWANQLQKQGIEVFFACSTDKVNLLDARKNINYWLKGHHVQIIHSHYQVGTITSISLKLSGAFRFLVRTAHANLEFGSGVLGGISRTIFQAILYPLIVDREIGVSRTITKRLNDQLLRKATNKTLLWIPNAISPTQAIESSINQSTDWYKEFPQNPWLITTIGILVSIKNIDLLIQAMPQILKVIPDARLLVVGSGPEFSSLLKLAENLGIANYCQFLGQQQNITSILDKTNIFILPSSSEGISTVILEAMQNKVPVIASDIPGNSELIENHVSGLLIPVGEVDAVTKAIIWSHQHPAEMMRMAEKAYTQIGDYLMPEVCQKYLNLYRSLSKS